MSQPTVIVQQVNPLVIASAAGAQGPQGPSGGGGGSALARTGVKTGNYTAAAGDLVPVDTTSQAVTIALPSAPPDKTQVAVELVTQGGSNAVTVACSGSDVLSKTGGPTSLALPLLGQAAWLEYTAAGAIWTPLSIGYQLAALDARYDATGAASAALTAAEANAAATYVPLSAEGAPNGVATLDGSGHLTAAQAANLVDLSANQSVGGTKAFTSPPTAPSPVGSTDLVNKAYADSIAQGLSVKPSARLATTAALPANTYNNGASGLGATLTATATGVLSVDGQAVAAGDRILVQNEAAPANNGLYQCTAAGGVGVAYVLTRTLDMDLAVQIPGAFVFVEQGSVNAAAGFVVAGAGPYVIGTTAMTWTQFSGAGEILAGHGLTKTGNTLALAAPVAASDLPSLDQLTAPASALSLNSQKVTSLANGTLATDAAAFGQIPVAGATAGTYAAGNDSRVTGAAQKSANLSDLGNIPAARTALGLGTQAQQNFGTPTGALAEIITPWNCNTSGGSPLTAGVLILNLIRPGPILVTNLAIWITLAGITANGVNALALYDESATLIDQTGDMSAQFATLGLAEAPLGAQHQLAANTNYYIGVLAHFSGTTPKAASSLAGVTIPVMRGHYLSLTKSSIASFPASFTPSTYATSTAAYAMQMS